MGTDEEDGNPTRFEFFGQDISPEEISSKILKKLVKDANEELLSSGVINDGEEIKDVVITCPAYFGMREKKATQVAGELAGLNVLDIINEPTAAAINYGLLKKENKKNVMVYDLGGGTFDITIIQIDGGNINVVFSDGDRSLGGKDWDQAVADYLAEEFEKATGVDFYSDEESANDIMLKAENAKRSLSSKTNTRIALNSGGKRQTIELSRDKFNELTNSLLQTTLMKVDDCLANAAKGEYKVTLNDIDEILLVGGSSKMPQIADTLKAKYNKPTNLFDPDEAVAKGAASYAQIRSSYEIVISQIAKQTGKSAEEIKNDMQTSDASVEELASKAGLNVAGMKASGSLIGGMSSIKISDTLSRTYGQELLKEFGPDTFVSNILMKGEKLPAEREERSYTIKDGQTGCMIKIYESEASEKEIECNEATLLGEAMLDFGKPLPEGTEILTKLQMDNSGLLKMVATEASTNSIVRAEFTPSGGLSSSELTLAASRSKSEAVN